MQALIVDDEPLKRGRIKALLRAEPAVKIAAECCDGREVVAAIRKHRPDLVFLDAGMPILDCLALLETVRAERMPAVILVTRTDECAVLASKLDSPDSLLNPVDYQGFQEAVVHARAQVTSLKSSDAGLRFKPPAEAIQRSGKGLERLAFKSAGRVCFLRTAEIDWIEAAGNYLRLHVGKNVHLLRQTLSGLGADLNTGKFLRIHRSTIVNIERIRALEPWFNGDSVMTLVDGTELVVSRTYRRNLREAFGGSL